MGKTAAVARGALEWLLAFALALVFFLFIRTFVIEPFQVPSASMEPTIEVGDIILAEKVSVNLGQGVEAGDIVVFRNPDASSDHAILVKRVIATGGQTVDVRGGAVYVDGERKSEPYAAGMSYELPTQAPGASVSFPYTVPEGSVWLMGDNRENSADSRYFGAVPQESIIGVAVFRPWPLNRLGVL